MTNSYIATLALPDVYLDWDLPELDWSAEVESEFPFSDTESDSAERLLVKATAERGMATTRAKSKQRKDIEDDVNKETFDTEEDARAECGGVGESDSTVSSELRDTPNKKKKRKRTRKSRSAKAKKTSNPSEESEATEDYNIDLAERSALLDSGARELLHEIARTTNESRYIINPNLAAVALTSGLNTSITTVSPNRNIAQPSDPRGAPGPVHCDQAPSDIREDTEMALAITTAAPAPDEVSDVGLARELHRRRIADKEPVNANKNQQPKLVPEMTFEVTYHNDAALFDDYIEVANMLSEAKRAEDSGRTLANKLKINSKKIRCGDWLVWANDESTRDWLAGFFMTEEFTKTYKATLMADRGEMVKYKIRVQAPDSTHDFADILGTLFEGLGDFGYRRFVNETRWYKDPKVNDKYQAAVKKKKTSQFKDGGSEYDKLIWIKMSLSAHELLQENWDKLNVWYGLNPLTIERPADRGDKRDSKGQQVSSGSNAVDVAPRRANGPSQDAGGSNALPPPRRPPPKNNTGNGNVSEVEDYDELIAMDQTDWNVNATDRARVGAREAMNRAGE